MVTMFIAVAGATLLKKSCHLLPVRSPQSTMARIVLSKARSEVSFLAASCTYSW